MNKKIQLIREFLKQKFLERDEVIDGMLTAILSHENLFLLGPPGTAKSALCESLCKSIDGNYFSWLVGKFTTPEELFGPLSLKGLENDKYERVTTGKLPTANIGFLDEIFKGSSAILNTLLPVINERIFYNGSTAPINIPLQVLFGASNEIPQAEELAALYDRFALRYTVDRIKNDNSVKSLFKGGLSTKPIPKITAAELKKEQVLSEKVVVPDLIVNVLIELRRAVQANGIYVSDRKWMQAIRVVKSFAHLNDHMEVEEDDFDILTHLLWSTPEQFKLIRKLVGAYSNPLGEKIIDITDSIGEVIMLMKKKEIEPFEAHKKCARAVKDLELLKKKSDKPNKKLDEAIKELRIRKEFVS